MALSPTTVAEVAAMLAEASASGQRVLPIGGGTHLRQGRPEAVDLDLSTRGLNRIVAHEPADLTVTVEGGVSVVDLDAALATAGQCWPQVDVLPGATVGGVLAAAVSGRTRIRNGPVRDGLLEVVVATGDGRVVKAGGKTVKGVAGFDLCRLLVGSMGSLGVICEVTLKLWPRPAALGWFGVQGSTDDCLAAARRVMATHHRPAALILTPGALAVQLAGTPSDVVAPEDFAVVDEPTRLSAVGRLRVGVPPTRLAEMVASLDQDRRAFEALVGVGSVEVAVESTADIEAVRAQAIALGGHAIVIDGPGALRVDPWGPPPPGAGLMKRIKATFDPAGILAPGRLVEAM